MARYDIVIAPFKPLADYLRNLKPLDVFRKPKDSAGLVKKLEGGDKPIAQDLTQDLDKPSSVINPFYMMSALFEGMDANAAKRFLGEQPKSK